MKYVEVVAHAGSFGTVVAITEKDKVQDCRLGVVGEDGMQQMRLLVGNGKRGHGKRGLQERTPKIYCNAGPDPKVTLTAAAATSVFLLPVVKSTWGVPTVLAAMIGVSLLRLFFRYVFRVEGHGRTLEQHHVTNLP